MQEHEEARPDRDRKPRRSARPAAGRLAGARPRPARTEAAVQARQVLELLTLVVPQTTLVTALLFWFGVELVDARSSYFGLGTGTSGFSTTDYLIRGVEAGVVPLIALSLPVLGGVVVYMGTHHLADRWRGWKQFRWVIAAVMVVGASAVGAGAFNAICRSRAVMGPPGTDRTMHGVAGHV